MTESLAIASTWRCYPLQCPCCGGVLELIWSRRFRITVRDGQQIELSPPR